MPDALAAKILHLARLARAGGVVFLTFVLGLYLLPGLAPGLSLWTRHWAQVAVVGGFPLAAASTMGPGDRLLFIVTALPYLGCLVWAFLHLDRMLRAFERREFFARGTIRHLRAFAGLLLLARALALIAGHLRVAFFASLFDHTSARVSMSITSDQLALLLLCALMFLVAHMLEEGGRLEEENRSFL
jgi:Protein of unknown function (DUF2975)